MSQSCLEAKGVTMNVDAECEKSLTPRDVRSSIFDQTYEGTYEHKKYELNVR